MGKENYNPFKMWGSYLGAVILGFIAHSVGSLCNSFGSCVISKLILLLLIGIVFGFLIGWGIHSLFRRFS